MRRPAKSFWAFLILGLWISACNKQSADTELVNDKIKVMRLLTNGLENPLAIATSEPTFSWNLESQINDVSQTAYQILVASSIELLEKDSANLWNSGRVESGKTLHITYEGKVLKSKESAYWKVKTWTNQGRTEWSEVAVFGTGLLHQKDWWGRWIGFDYAFHGEKVESSPWLGARYLRTEFETKKSIKSATAYIVGLGLYELHLNGQKVGESVLVPPPTDYTQEVLYRAIDVTDYLKNGQNALGVTLGNGRYFTMRPNYKPYKIKHFGFPKLMFHLEIVYEDGSKEVIFSSDKWKGTADGPIRNNNEYDGEYYDSRKELTGWSEPEYDDSKWLSVDYVAEPGGDYLAQQSPDMKVMQEVKAVSIQKNGSSYIVDFGQNMSGWIEMTASGKRGQEITIRYAESLHPDGSIFTTNLRDAKSTDIYIMKGLEPETWEPRFTYHGFRYVEVSGLTKEPTKEDFTAKLIYDDLPTVGQFRTSDTLLNQLFENAWWTIASSYKGMPVDCPQRNERQPWLADHAEVAYGESFLFDNTTFYKKWLQDIRSSQKSDGSISDVAPAFWNYYSDNMTWPGTYLLVANMLYVQTGDKSVISEHYDAMKKWLFYMRDRYMNEQGIITKDSYGDWCVPPKTIEEATGANADVKKPSPLIATAYYFHFMNLMQRFAVEIGREDDLKLFRKEADDVKAAFNEQFYHEEGFYGDNKMTDNLLPLYFGLSGVQSEKVFDHLVKTIEEENGGHLSTGLIGTQWLMRTLSAYGRSDLALRFATNKTYPSWGYMLENGSTTIWELWHGNVANPKMNSQNHVMMLGDLLIWYYENLAGIKALLPGYEVIEMKPAFGVNLTEVDASYRSVRGMIASHWTKSEKEIVWDVEIPANSSAILHFPVKSENALKESNGYALKVLQKTENETVVEISSGKYEFQVIL